MVQLVNPKHVAGVSGNVSCVALEILLCLSRLCRHTTAGCAMLKCRHITEGCAMLRSVTPQRGVPC